MSYRSRLMICTAMVGCIAGNAAFAQQEAQAPAKQEAQIAGGLEEVTVTARKQAESILDVPLAITAISAEQFEERHIVDVNDIANFTPGYTNQNQAVARNDRYYRQAVIRGVIPGNALATRQTASIFVDGALVFGGNISNLTDISHVEVIKGPQSAYFGRGTFAGAINFVTRPPDMNKWGGKMSVDASSFRTTNITASVEGPVIDDKLAIRVAGYKFHTSGNYDNVGFPGEKLGRRDTKSGTVNFIAKPTDEFKVTGFVSYAIDDDGLPANAEFTDANWNCNGGAAPAGQLNYTCGKLGTVPTASRFWNSYIDPVAYSKIFVGLPTVPNSASYHGIGFPDHMGLTRKQFNARMAGEYELPAGYTLSANGAWDSDEKGFLQGSQFIDTRNVPNPFYPATPNVLPYNYSLVSGQAEDKSENAEVRFTSPQTDRIKWMIGGNYFHNRGQSQTLSYGNAGFQLANARSIFVNHTYGLFGSVNIDLWGGFSVIGEARHQWEQVWQTTLSGTNPVFENNGTSFTPRVILQYKPEEDLTLYASYAEGKRPVQFNTNYYTLTASQRAEVDAQAPVAGLVPADKLKMGELGVKGVFLGGTLRLLADVYYGKWTGRPIPQTVSFTLPNGLQSAIQISSAGGVVDLSGVEIEGAYKATDEITMEGSFGIAHSKIKKTYSADALTLTGNANPVGKKLPSFPEMQGNFAVTYARAITEDYDGFVRVDYFYRGKIYESEANLAWTAPSNKFNLSLGVENETYKLEFYGKNLTDNRVPTSLSRNGIAKYNAAGTQTSTVSGIAVSLADPRTYGIRASAKF